MEIQGSAPTSSSWRCCTSTAGCRREALRSRMLLQIHDELVFEAPPEELTRWRRWSARR